MKCDELTRYEVRADYDAGTINVPCENDKYGKYMLAEDVDAAIAELKQKLEDAGMRERKLKRALWLARSYRGRDNSILLPSKFMRNVWDNVERKCLKKAEQYE